MKLLKTISKMVLESQKALDYASEKGVHKNELESLEKNYNESLKLLRLYEQVNGEKNN